MAVLIFLILGCSALCGKMFARRFELREKVFVELESFCMFSKTEIAFCQTKVGDIYLKFFNSFVVTNKQFFEELKSISEGAKQSFTFENQYYLKKNEKEKIVEFGKLLGKMDEKNQILNIEHFSSLVNFWKNEACLKRKQNQPLCYKLSLAVGALICILIL